MGNETHVLNSKGPITGLPDAALAMFQQGSRFDQILWHAEFREEVYRTACVGKRIIQAALQRDGFGESARRMPDRFS